MPTTYAHDLFGKMVYHKLEPEIQQIIERHKMSYIIGLHGPDILFYTRPFHRNRVNRLGFRLHGEIAADFFEKGKEICRENQNEEVLAYLLGFVCHFMLDSTCHPYIYKYMEKTGAAHDEIETELDRELMLSTGKNPFWYHPSGVIKREEASIKAISQVLEGMSEKDISHTLEGMKFYTNMMVCHTALERRILRGIARVTGIYWLLQGKVILKRPRKKCSESTAELKRLFSLAVPETVTVLEGYYRAVIENRELDARFNRNYK
ncbi:MAG: zinc dependent phospholipase C family protein [Eubacteriales bacterium]|nr:zinc dependent phospholipase C family protein [Eubacteriales bacterium]